VSKRTVLRQMSAKSMVKSDVGSSVIALALLFSFK
jgi:hypothetical protein